MSSSKSRAQRIRDFGIDCGDGLEWGGGTWKPGGEYIKHLPVKNVSTKIQKVRYKLPETKFFSMEFPDPIRLAPGNEVLLEVRFRPIRLEEYDDYIEFYTPGGTFKVPVRARLSHLAVQVPEFLDTGLCPVNETMAKTIELVNVGEIAATFEWEVPFPFTIEPPSGEINTGSKKTLTVYTHPTDANVFESKAICRIYGAPEKTAGTHGVSGPSKLIRTLHLYAVGKYQYIKLEKEVVDFGKVLISADGYSHKRSINLTNMSPVPVTLTVKRLDSDRLPDFALTPKNAVIPRYGSITMTIAYRPRVPGYYSSEKFVLLTPGGNVARLTAHAMAQGPIVTLYRKDSAGSSLQQSMRQTTFNFGDLYLPPTGNDAIGKKSQSETPIKTLVLTLRNMSATAAHFSFDTGGLGVFRLSQTYGSIAPYLSTEIVVAFRPPCFGNYYRRLYCRVRDSNPIFADLLGTAYDDKQRPFPLKEIHIDMFRLRPPAVRLLSSAELNNLISTLQGEDDESTVEGEGTFGASLLTSTKLSQRKKARPFLLSIETLMNEREFRLHYPEILIAQSSKAVGASRPTSSSLKKTLGKVKDVDTKIVLPTEEMAEVSCPQNSNLTSGHYACMTRSGEMDRAHCALYSEFFGGVEESPVQVLDTLLDFGAGSRTRINEKKSLRIKNNSRYKVSVQIVLPVSRKALTTDDSEDTQFRSLYIEGDYNWHVPNATFDVDANSTVETTISFRPLLDDTYYSEEMEIYFSPKLNRSFRLVDEEAFIPPLCQCVELRGHTFRTTEQFVPRLEPVLRPSCADHTAEDALIKGIRDIQMPSCFIGDTTFYTFELLNSGDTPATYRIEGQSTVFAARPCSGKIESGEFQLITVRFSPKQMRMHKENLKLIMNEDPDHAQYLALCGIGTSPTLQLHNIPPNGTIYIKPTCIGVTSTATFELHNTSRTPLNYCWTLQGASKDQFRISPSEGYLQGNDTVSVTISFFPTRKGSARLNARCDATPAGDVDVDWDIARMQAQEWSNADSADDSNNSLKLVYADSVEQITDLVSERKELENEVDREGMYSVSVGVSTEAGPGALQFSPPSVNFNSLLIDSTRHRTVTITNHSDCTVHFRLGAFADAYEQCLKKYEFYSRQSSSHDPASCVVFEPSEYTLQPRSSVSITVSFTPQIPARYVIRSFYEIIESNSSTEISSESSEQLKVSMNAADKAARREASSIANGHLVRMDDPPTNGDVLWCELIGCGAYPSVVFEDARGLNSIESLLTFFPKPPLRRNVPLLCQDMDQEREEEKLYYHSLNVNYGRDGVAFLSTQTSNDRTLPENRDACVPVGGDSQGGWLFPCTVGFPGDVHPLVLPASHTGQEKKAREEVGEVMSYQDLSTVLLKYLGIRRDVVPNADAIQFKLHNSISSSSNMWLQMSLRDLNYTLSSPLTEKELEFNRATRGMNPADYLQTIPLEFTPAPVGSPPQLIAFSMRNNNRLPASVDIRWEHDPDVDIEPWAATTEPTETEVRLRQLVDRRIFGVMPRKVTLEPGESKTIYFFYSYISTVSKGVHELPLIIRVFKGKQVRLLLRGRTLDPCAPFIHLNSPKKVYELSPVPLGCVDAPRQPIKLINPTGVDVVFALDDSPLENLARESYNFSVLRATMRPPFRIMNPSGKTGEITEPVVQQLLSGMAPESPYDATEKLGIIPAQSETTIWVTFQPLEAREYVCPLRILYTYANILKPMPDTMSKHDIQIMVAHARKVDPSGAFFPTDHFASFSTRTDDVPPLLEDVGELTIKLKGTGYNPQAIKETHIPYDDPRGVPDLGIGAGVIRDGYSVELIKHELQGKQHMVKKFKNIDTHPNAPVVSRFASLHRAESAMLDRWHSALYSVTGKESGQDDFFTPLEDAYSSIEHKVAENRYQWVPPANRATKEVVEQRERQRKVYEQFLEKMDLLNRHSTGEQPKSYDADHDKRISEGGKQEVEFLQGTNFRPGEEPEAFFGGSPAWKRYLSTSEPWIPESYVDIFGESLHFGDVTTTSVSQKIIVLRNGRDEEALHTAVHRDYVRRAKDLATEKSEQQDRMTNEQGAEGKAEASKLLLKGEEYSITMERNVGDGSGPVAFCFDMTNPLIRSGVVKIHPARGVIDPDAYSVVRISFHAPPTPCVIDADIALAVGITMAELRAHASAVVKACQVRNRRSNAGGGKRGPPDPVHVSVAMKSTFSRSKSIEEATKEKLEKTKREQERLNTAEGELVTQTHAPLEALQGQADIASMMARILAPTEIVSPQQSGMLLKDPSVLCSMSVNLPELKDQEDNKSGRTIPSAVIGLEDKSVGERLMSLPLTRAGRASMHRIEGVSDVAKMIENFLQLNPTTVYGSFLPQETVKGIRGGMSGSIAEGSSAISGSGKGTMSVSRFTKGKTNAALQSFMHLPGVPRGRLYVHVGGRVCSDSEYLDAHGRISALSMRHDITSVTEHCVPKRLAHTLFPEMRSSKEEEVDAKPAELPDDESTDVITDVITEMLADVVADKSIDQVYRVSRQKSRRSARCPEGGSSALSLRQVAIQEDECAEITARCLESTILSICKGLVNGELS